MKTIAHWAYPAAVLTIWIALAAYTLSGLSTVEPLLRAIAASSSAPTLSPAPAAPVARHDRGQISASDDGAADKSQMEHHRRRGGNP